MKIYKVENSGKTFEATAHSSNAGDGSVTIENHEWQEIPAGFISDLHNGKWKDPVKNAASIMGKKGGPSKTEKKAAASRENGKKGGRPKGKKVKK